MTKIEWSLSRIARERPGNDGEISQHSHGAGKQFVVSSRRIIGRSGRRRNRFGRALGGHSCGPDSTTTRLDTTSGWGDNRVSEVSELVEVGQPLRWREDGYVAFRVLGGGWVKQAVWAQRSWGAEELFVSKALLWFRSVRKSFGSWEELVRELKWDFCILTPTISY